MQRVNPDALTATTAENYFVLAFKENQPGVGLVKMVMVFDNIIRSEKSATVLPSSTSQINIGGLIFIVTVIVMLYFIMLTVVKSISGDSWGYGDGDGGGGGDGGGSSTSF